jgi:hypothetical protein
MVELTLTPQADELFDQGRDAAGLGRIAERCEMGSHVVQPARGAVRATRGPRAHHWRGSSPRDGGSVRALLCARARPHPGWDPRKNVQSY